jgi:hypothetical protein
MGAMRMYQTTWWTSVTGCGRPLTRKRKATHGAKKFT